MCVVMCVKMSVEMSVESDLASLVQVSLVGAADGRRRSRRPGSPCSRVDRSSLPAVQAAIACVPTAFPVAFAGDWRAPEPADGQ